MWKNIIIDDFHLPREALVQYDEIAEFEKFKLFIFSFVVQFIEKQLILSFLSHKMKRGRANDRDKFSTDSQCNERHWFCI